MHYLNFLRQLFESGRVVIESAEFASQSAISASESLLADFEHQWRTQLAGDAPTFDVEVATWAGQNFYRACQLLMHRNLAEEDASIGFPEFRFATGIFHTQRKKSSWLARSQSLRVDLCFAWMTQLNSAYWMATDDWSSIRFRFRAFRL